ncbi:MAG: hypothetical protein AABZ64_15285 [Nitrospinota bacterium]
MAVDAPATKDDRIGRPPFIPGTPEALDAVIAAPGNHEVLIENGRVRVVRVTIQPGELEKMHTHKWPSVFIITRLPKIVYYTEKMEAVPPSGTRREGVPMWIEPEGVHAVENVDTRMFEGIRVELKER